MRHLNKIFVGLFLIFGCNEVKTNESLQDATGNKIEANQIITVLGIAQDAGYPQIGCNKACCDAYYNGNESKKMVSCLGLVDRKNKGKWLFDATPDIVEQTYNLNKLSNSDNNLNGIFLTHAHIGHYTGLMHLGREALGGHKVPVYAMPRMSNFLETNGPWNQLVELGNIEINRLEHDSLINLNTALKVVPFLVPHRDEYSETVGYKIIGTNKSAIFIPDIDKWETWERSIIEEVKKVDYAFLDASFFSDGELERDMSQIPHPFTTQTTTLFQNESLETKKKIYFIHFNHTNPAIKEKHRLKDSIQALGFNFAKQGENFRL
ncbi:MBL fold metallo-hydrolase [Winogradskyella poriferorum]|uniref:MBL fold metallo-hydrolase n=1 Tax=Winogradskyella poriferorum TaxID=307627 RepID=UPI003D650836